MQEIENKTMHKQNLPTQPQRVIQHKSEIKKKQITNLDPTAKVSKRK